MSAFHMFHKIPADTHITVISPPFHLIAHSFLLLVFPSALSSLSSDHLLMHHPLLVTAGLLLPLSLLGLLSEWLL